MAQSIFKLAQQFTPKTYNLSLDLTKRLERTFSGTITIVGGCANNSDTLSLHSKDLTINSATINGIKTTWQHADNDVLQLKINQDHKATEYTIKLSFSGKITDPMHGLYPCYFKHNGQAKELLMTQLESHHARELFPCIDEPEAKAIYNLTLLTETDITVLSNTPVKQSSSQNDVLTTVFEPTPKMSSYLLAFVSGELAYKETTSTSGVAIRCYATPDKVQHTDFALGFAAKVLEFYDDYFDLPYPLAKCDLVAVPDFAAGAMENWGLITFRENALLYDKVNSAADVKEWVAVVVAHELAHQWFGNLVTMKWWDDLWLNESFAKWMEHYAVDKLVPEWRMWDSFGAQEQQYAFSRDSLASVQAVRQPVNHPDELHSLFDPAIVYSKGACLMRMLQNFVGETAFRDGLRVYMKAHKYNNATAHDLWKALDTVTDKDVQSFMGTWLEQPGHPVVKITSTGNSVSVLQERFYADPTQNKDQNTVWPVPLLSNQLSEHLLTKKTATYTATKTPVQLNKGFTGFYHTSYDSKTLSEIGKLIATAQLPVTERQGFLVDGLALTKAGQQSTTNLMSLLAAYKNEASYPVWQAIGSVVSALRTIINDDPKVKPYLQRFITALASEQFNRLGLERKQNEPYFDELLRPSIIALMAYADTQAAVEPMLDIFNKAKNPNDILLPELRSIAYSVAVREQGEPAFNKLMEWYKAMPSADERVNIVSGLSNTRNSDLARQATQLFATKAIKPQDLVYWFIYFIRSRHARNVTWEWMQNNWDWIVKQFKNSHDYSDFPKYSGSALSTQQELDRYKAFFEPKLKEKDIALVIRQSIEDINIRVQWRERDFDGLVAYLKKQA